MRTGRGRLVSPNIEVSMSKIHQSTSECQKSCLIPHHRHDDDDGEEYKGGFCVRAGTK